MNRLTKEGLDVLKNAFQEQLRTFVHELDNKQLGIMNAVENNLGCVAIRNEHTEEACKHLIEGMKGDDNMTILIFTLAYFGYEDCIARSGLMPD